MPKKFADPLNAYETILDVPKYNLMALNLASIENELEYLLFVDHEEGMEGYSHLRPLLGEVAELVVRIADRAVAEFQRDVTQRIAAQLQETIGEQIANVILDTQMKTTRKAIVKTVVDKEQVMRQTVELGPHHDW